MTDTRRSGRVLVVDDEEAVADLYVTWLETDHDVTCTHDGKRAVELVDETIDVVVIDRRMPKRSGDDVIEYLDDQAVNCRTVMVTAVDPGFDIVEMPLDEYLIKPVTRSELTETVDEMLTRSTYDEVMQEYFALVSKKATLEAQIDRIELAENDGYAEISRRVERLRQQVDATAAQFDTYEGLFRELSRGN